MNASAAGLTFIRTKEQLALTAYRDGGGGGVLTIGWGHTGADVHEGDTIDMERAMALFRADVAHAEAEVRRVCFTHTLTQVMFDALVSFEFNTGGLEIVAGGKAQPSRVLQAVNERRWCDAVEELVRWNMDAGKGVRGLLIRRLEEGLMFAGEKFPA